jgi:hypothetical protein
MTRGFYFESAIQQLPEFDICLIRIEADYQAALKEIEILFDALPNTLNMID